MDHARANDGQENKQWYRDHFKESGDQRPSDSGASISLNPKTPFRRVRSPSRPRAWSSVSHKSKFGVKVFKPYFPRDDRFFQKPSYFTAQRYPYMKYRSYAHRKDYYPPKHHHILLREKEKARQRQDEEKEDKKRYEEKQSKDRHSPPKQSHTSGPSVPRSTSSRDKDMQFTVSRSDKSQSKERDPGSSKSKERERSREGELPLTASQTASRDRAIQQRRKEIDEVYYQECEMFGLVAKMLIAKDLSLEQAIQASLRENLRDIGKRCVEAMEKFIKDYDSREPSH